MSITLQTIVTNKNPVSSRALLARIHFSNPRRLVFSAPNSTINFPVYRFSTTPPRPLPVRKVNASFDEPYGKSNTQIDGSSSASYVFDGFLSILEFLCLASSAAMSAYVALGNGVPKSGISGSIVGKVLVWQCVILATGALIGAFIRRRQWWRIRGFGFSSGSASYGADFKGRVEKLEEDLRSSAIIIRVLSRQLEKLGIRVRIMRKDLKEPIAETAALAQKNSEVTRAVAAQEDILEKELSEIQKVLMAMQEQQQKQLKLILAIAQGRKFLETGPKPTEDQHATVVEQDAKTEVNQVKSRELPTENEP